MGRVVVLGSLNVDLVTRVERHPRPGETLLGEGLERLAGGKGANQAVAARLAGAEVAMVGCVGDDDGGAAYVARLSALGIDCSGIRTVRGTPTGHALVTVDEAGENAIVVIPGANAARDGADLAPLDGLRPDDVVLAQLEVPSAVTAAAVRRAAARGARVVVNLAPYAGLPAGRGRRCRPVVVNEHEALQLADSGLVPSTMVVTFGAAGVAWDGLRVDRSCRCRPTRSSTRPVPVTPSAARWRPRSRAGPDPTRRWSCALAAGAAAVRRRGAQPDPAAVSRLSSGAARPRS